MQGWVSTRSPHIGHRRPRQIFIGHEASHVGVATEVG